MEIWDANIYWVGDAFSKPTSLLSASSFHLGDSFVQQMAPAPNMELFLACSLNFSLLRVVASYFDVTEVQISTSFTVLA